MLALSLVSPLMAIGVSIASVLRGAGDTAATFCGISTRLIAGTVVVLLDGPVIWLFATLFADYGVKVVILLWKKNQAHGYTTNYKLQ